MAIELYNSLTRSVQEFTPIVRGKVGLYTCGPTVYGPAHIGNFRAYVFADTLRRTLELSGLVVKHVMNLTDVDDKTMRDSKALGQSLSEFTEHYSQVFYADRDKLNILPAHIVVKATDHIKEMLEITEQLLEKGIAYKSEDGSIYFNITKDKEYGKLAHLDMSHLRENAGGRMKADEYDKENAQDFALWKSYDPEDGDVFWEPAEILGHATEITKGHPGWHIECSAMSMKYLGKHFDIHTGGKDNMFPHHENEIAQSECATGEQFVNYWLHNEWLLVDGKKMAKSAKNFYTLPDIEARGFSPLAFRYLALQAHYRTPLNFTWDSLEAASVALKKLQNIVRELPEGGEVDPAAQDAFERAIYRDLGMPEALALLWDTIKNDELTPEAKKATVLYFDKVLGLGLDKIVDIEIPADVVELLEKRKAARAGGDFAMSDNIRKQIEDAGFEVKDTPEGQKVTSK